MKRILLILFASGALILAGCDSEPEDWKTAQGENTTAAYQNYLESHPDGDHAEQARERVRSLEADAAWTQARQTDTLAAYRAFRKNHPNSQHAAEARQRMSGLRQAEQAAARNRANRGESLVTAEGDTQTVQDMSSDIGAAAAPVIKQLETLNEQIAQAETALSATPANAQLEQHLAELEAQRNALENRLIDMAEARDREMRMQAEENTESVEDTVEDATGDVDGEI